MKIPIICENKSDDGSIHGLFFQSVDSHQCGHGCSKCYGNNQSNKEEFIKKSLSIFEFKEQNYNYDDFEYKNVDTKGKIKCPKHGFFLKTPHKHIKDKQGCPECVKEKLSGMFLGTKERFIERALNVKEHKGKNYDYSSFVYTGYNEKGKIFCQKKGHGFFLQKPAHHLDGSGCPICGIEKSGNTLRYSLDRVINKAKEIHKNIYDYSLITEYKNNKIKLPIKCNICDFVFSQTMNSHLDKKSGCPICDKSKGEIEIRNFLKTYDVKFLKEHKFDGCKNKQKLPFDFYLSDYNICIEYDGRQHFQVIEYFGGQNGFNNLKKNDNIKNNYCKNNNIKLIRIKYTENVENILKEELEHIL